MVKLFKDPVHNNIRIPTDICRDFIDTELFQRLRFVEQSTMRTLFPSAGHDRFVHSLGVYWLACKMFEHLRGKLFDMVKSEDCLHRMQSTFEIAALLHDCAHSPFSHTGEMLAQYCNDDINRSLISVVNSPSFSRDYLSDGTTHEVASAYVACKKFEGELLEHSVDKEQLSRMIIGCPNSNTQDLKLAAYNILISLVNGFVLDVDRLDYLLRDTWATGISNATVDVETLISGFDIDSNSNKVMIHGKALSGLLNAVYARDYIRRWIVSHHKVVFYNMILRKAMDALMDVFKMRHDKWRTENKCVSEGASTFGERSMNVAEVRRFFFSPDRLLKSSSFTDEVVYLPTDGDVLYWMKKYVPDDKYVRAYVSRKNDYLSLWKGVADFAHIFRVNQKLLDDYAFWAEIKGCFTSYVEKRHLDALVSDPQEIKHDAKVSGVPIKIAHDLTGCVFENKGECSLMKDVVDLRGQRDRVVLYFYLKRESSEDKTTQKCREVIADLAKIFERQVPRYMKRKFGKNKQR